MTPCDPEKEEHVNIMDGWMTWSLNYCKQEFLHNWTFVQFKIFHFQEHFLDGETRVAQRTLLSLLCTETVTHSNAFTPVFVLSSYAGAHTWRLTQYFFYPLTNSCVCEITQYMVSLEWRGSVLRRKKKMPLCLHAHLWRCFYWGSLFFFNKRNLFRYYHVETSSMSQLQM